MGVFQTALFEMVPNSGGVGERGKMSCEPPSFLLPLLSEKLIETYINGPQNYRKGKLLVACGFVYKVSLIEAQKLGESDISASAFVHAEMSTNKYYLTKATLNLNGIIESTCVCKAHGNEHNQCKHIAALLLSILLHIGRPSPPPDWITKRKRKVNRMSYPGWRIHERIKVDLTFDDILNGFESDPPRHHNNKLPCLVKEVEVSRKQKRKVGKDMETAASLPPPCESLPAAPKEVRTSKKVSEHVEPPPKKRHRQDIFYPPEIAQMSESAKEKWRLDKIYSENIRDC